MKAFKGSETRYKVLKEMIDVNLYDKLKKIKENKKNFYSRDDDWER